MAAVVAGGDESSEQVAEQIPAYLRERAQWVVWRRGEQRKAGKFAKVPYNPRSGRKASTVDVTTWGTFDEARHALATGEYEGLGIVLTPPIVGIDKDDCVDPATGVISAEARAIIERVPSYAEFSPSGTGLHIIATGILPTDGRKNSKIEIYTNGRFLTVTGQRVPGTTAEITDQADPIAALYTEYFGDEPPSHPNAVRGTINYEARDLPDVSDEEVLARCQRGRNARKFKQVWQGDLAAFDGDESAGDIYIVGALARQTQDEEQIDRLFRQSGLMRDKWDRPDGQFGTYGRRTITTALHNVGKSGAAGGARRGSATEVPYLYPEWQGRPVSERQRRIAFSKTAYQIQFEVRAHLKARDTDTMLVIAAPPGSGKSTAVAALGAPSGEHPAGEFDLAWIAPRKEMVKGIEPLGRYHVREPVTPENCSEAKRAVELAKKGYSGTSLHKGHGCTYGMQFEVQKGSTVFQLPHTSTPYILGHDDGIVIDEFDLLQWLEERKFTLDEIQTAKQSAPMESPAYRLLHVVALLLFETTTPLTGKALFDALDQRSGGQLADLIKDLARDPDATTVRPSRQGLSSTEERNLPQVVLPHIYHALVADLPRWQSGRDWNSLLRSDGALFVSTPRQLFEPSEGTLPPRVVLDGTVNPEFLSAVLSLPPDRIKVIRPVVLPPPGMQHIAVRTGKRYGKYSLTQAKNADDDFGRALRAARHLLDRYDPDHTLRQAGRVGIVTFKEIEARMRTELGIRADRSLHFWGARGSNSLEECDILLVLGTPRLRDEDVFRLARGIWRDDPELIDEAMYQDEQQRWRYQDPRVERLANYLSKAEVTQAAHRNRPLRYDERIVITMCDAEVADLPITLEITALPRFTAEGQVQSEARAQEVDRRCTEVAAQLVAEGKGVTIRAVRGLTHLDRNVVAEWVKAWRQRQLQDDESDDEGIVEGEGAESEAV